MYQCLEHATCSFVNCIFYFAKYLVFVLNFVSFLQKTFLSIKSLLKKSTVYLLETSHQRVFHLHLSLLVYVFTTKMKRVSRPLGGSGRQCMRSLSLSDEWNHNYLVNTITIHFSLWNMFILLRVSSYFGLIYHLSTFFIIRNFFLCGSFHNVFR